MTPEILIKNAITPALDLLPVMDSPQARIILLAIAFQESGIKHRKQVKGPARGYWQFEQGGGVVGVLTHKSSAAHIKRILSALDYLYNATDCYVAIEHNDILAAVFARLLLWTDPFTLPLDAEGAWKLYLRTWRPGKPHPSKWAGNFAKAVEAVV